MRERALLLIHLIATAKLLQPGSARSITAESPLLKHQLLILNRSRARAPICDPSIESLLACARARCVVLVSFERLSFSARRIIGFAVQPGVVDGAAVCRMFDQVIAVAPTLPQHLSSDHDPLFKFHRWQANLRTLDVSEIKTVPHVPLSHPFVERLIGTVRRELLDQVPFWGAADLERKLLQFRDYYNDDRVHASLEGHTPICKTAAGNRSVIDLDDYQWRSHCRGLYQPPAGR